MDDSHNMLTQIMMNVALTFLPPLRSSSHLSCCWAIDFGPCSLMCSLIKSRFLKSVTLAKNVSDWATMLADVM